MTPASPLQLKTLQPRERRLALIAGVVIGCWVLLVYLVQPLWARTQELNERVRQETERLEAMSSLVERAGPAQEAYLAVAPLLGQGEAGANAAFFLNALESMAQSAGVRLNIAPRSSVSADGVSRSNVELDAEGEQQNIIAFLDAVLTMPALASIERLRVSMAPGKSDLLRANLLVQHIQLQTP
jgi:hypothetical protein